MENNQSDHYKSIWLISFILKFKWFLLLSGFIGATIVYLGCLITTPKYQSSAIVYPAGVNPGNPMMLTEGNALLLLQLLESSYLKDSLIDSLDLAAHYGIDTNKKAWKQAVNKEYDKNVSFKRTLYKSVRIRVLDKDADFAAKMANAIVEINNGINSKIVKDNTVNQLKSIESAYLKKQEEVDKLIEEITLLKNKTVEYAADHLKVKLDRKNSQINSLRNQLNEIRKALEVHGLSQQLDEVHKLYTRAESLFNQESAKLAVYEEKLSPLDSLRIISEAQLAGFSKNMESLKIKLDELNEANDKYLRISNELSLQIQSRDQLVRRMETIQNTFEPGVQSIEMNKKESLFESELEQLATLKKEYEKAKSTYYNDEPSSYLISKATPDYKKAYPNTLLFAFIGFIFSLLLSFFVLLIFKKD